MKPHQWDLIGWDEDVTIRAKAVMELSSRALRLYQFFIVKQPEGFPSQKQIAAALTIGEETWSVPTVKRTIGELLKKGYIARSRRVKQVSVTQVFKVPATADKLTHDPIRGITGEPTVGSQVSPHTTTTLTDEKKTSAMLFMENIRSDIKYLEVESLMEGEKDNGFDVMKAAIQEAASSKSPEERRWLSVNYVLSIAVRMKKEGIKSKSASANKPPTGNNHKPSRPHEDDPRRFKEFTLD